jgi:hypothetical protein
MRLSGTRVTAIASGKGFGNQLWDLAGTIPTLDLRLAENKSLVDATTGQQLVTFTRASSGTYVGADGLIKTAVTNEARFDHNPTTGESLGLLVEEQRANLLVRSEEFDNASWTTNKTAITVAADQALAPNGTTTAESLVPDSGITIGTGSTNTFIRQDITKAASAITYTLSFYAKAFGYTAIRIVQRDNASSSNFSAVTFSLSDGSILNGPTTAGTFTSASASTVALANGWYRCQLTFTTGTETANRILVVPAASTNTTTDGTSGIYIWGAQIEAGSFPTSYIPTTTATVTRSADVASITGTNFSSWYRQDEGTVFVEGQFVGGTASSFPRMATLTSANINNDGIAVTWTANTGILRGGITSGGVNTADLPAGPNKFAGSKFRCIIATSSLSAQFASDGALATEDTTITLPTCTQLLIAQPARFQPVANTTIRRLTYWPQRLPNSTLQEITQ